MDWVGEEFIRGQIQELLKLVSLSLSFSHLSRTIHESENQSDTCSVGFLQRLVRDGAGAGVKVVFPVLSRMSRMLQTLWSRAAAPEVFLFDMLMFVSRPDFLLRSEPSANRCLLFPRLFSQGVSESGPRGGNLSFVMVSSARRSSG